MPEENKPQQESEQQGIFEDLLRETPISSLNIEEPEIDSFDIHSVMEQARQEAENSRRGSRVFGKRTKRAVYPEEAEVQPAQEQKDQPSASQILRESEPVSKRPTPSYSQAVESEKRQQKAGKPKTFRELLNAERLDNKDEDEPLDSSLVIAAPAIEEEVVLDENAPVVGKPVEHPVETRKDPVKEEKEPEAKPEKKEDDDEVIDPSASLVDDYHYDEYEDKKRFLLSDYKRMEEYLADQSEQGFHFVRHEGKKYYFIKGKPHHYYYKVLYFAKEPTPAQFEQWAEEGWKQVDQAPSRHRRDAGWYVLRNEKEEGSLPKDIENEEEKYRYFTKFSSSCRSTMLLLFIVMLAAVISIWLQIQFKGFQEVIWASVVLLVIALWVFLVYARMLTKSRKQASLLSARIRLADHDPDYQALRHAHETDAQLDDDWNSIGKDDEDKDDEEEN